MTLFLVDGKPMTLSRIQREDGEAIAEQIAFREQHGVEALRERERTKPPRHITLGDEKEHTQ